MAANCLLRSPLAEEGVSITRDALTRTRPTAAIGDILPIGVEPNLENSAQKQLLNIERYSSQKLDEYYETEH